MTNAHTHLELSDLGRLCPAAPTRFAPWIRRIVRAGALTSARRKSMAIARGIAELQACGTTHVGDHCGSAASVAPLRASGLGGIAYLEVQGFTRGSGEARLGQARNSIRALRRDSGVQVGLALHAPYTCHPELLRAAAAWCREEEVPLSIHVAESPDELRMLAEGSGPHGRRARLAGWLGLWPRLPRARPIPYLASLGVLEARPLLVHAVQVTDEDIRLIADAGCAVVHCPRSNTLLRCGRMPVERHLAAGVEVYLGTDSRASSPDLDVRREALAAAELHGTRVDAETFARMIARPFPPR